MKGTEFLYYMQEKVGVETENEAIGVHDHIIRVSVCRHSDIDLRP